MNMERTIETMAVVTPNCAIAKRNQTISYKMLQSPETKKNPKNHRRDMGRGIIPSSRATRSRFGNKVG